MEQPDSAFPASRRWIFQAVVFGTMGALLFCMMAGLEPWIDVAGVLGAFASVVLGKVSVQRQWMTIPEGIKRVGILWLWVVGFAALSLLNGKWEPAAFASVIGLTMTGFYAVGAGFGVSRRR